MKKQMNESYRGQTLLKYYKEDFISALKEFESLEFLQEAIHLVNTREKKMELLRIGMKKEDLNIMLFNAQNITDEVLENFKKPVEHRIPMILFRDIPLAREEIPSNIQLSVDLTDYSTVHTSAEKSEKMKFSDDLINARRTPTDSISFRRTREDSISNTLPETVIRRARQDSISETIPLSQNNQEVLEKQDDMKFSADLINALRTPTDSILFRRTREDFISNTIPETVIRRAREDSISEIVDQEKNNQEVLENQDETNFSADSISFRRTPTDLINALSPREDSISNFVGQEENNTKNDLEETSWDKSILENGGEGVHAPDRREGHHYFSQVNQEENNTKNDLVENSENKTILENGDDENDMPSLLSFGPGHNLLSQINQEESHHKSLLERSLLKIKERKLLEEQFQKKLKGLVKKKQEQYEKIKPTYQYQDKNYQFYQEYVVTLAKHYNVPIPTISAPVIVPSANLANLGYQLPGGRRPRRPL
jgi:hypothetical protein